MIKNRPNQKWLRIGNENHQQVADAMSYCQNASGSCFEYGYCVFGECFDGVMDKKIEILELKISNIIERLDKIESLLARLKIVK